MRPCLFVIKWLRILISRGPWEQGHIKSEIKCVPCLLKPAMITAESKKQNKTIKYQFKGLIDGTYWFWSGTHYFSWDESLGMSPRDSLMANCNKITALGVRKYPRLPQCIFWGCYQIGQRNKVVCYYFISGNYYHLVWV